MKHLLATLALPFAALAFAQEAEIVFDLRGEVPGLGPVVENQAASPFYFNDAFIRDDGTWFATVGVEGVGFALLENGLPLLVSGDVLPGGAVVNWPRVEGIEDGALALLLVRTTTNEQRLVTYDGLSFSEHFDPGQDLDQVSGMPPGVRFTNILSAELHADGSLTLFGYPSGGASYSPMLAHVTLDANGVVNGGTLHGGAGGPPPAGAGDVVQFVTDVEGNQVGGYFFSCIVQPNSRRRVFKDGSVYVREGDLFAHGSFGNVFVGSSFEITPDGSSLFAAASYNGGDDRGVVLKNDVEFAWGGMNVPGFGTVEDVHWQNARFLHGGLITWVGGDSDLPKGANETYFIEQTPVLTEGTFRVGDRWPQEILGKPIASSRSGRFLIADLDLHPGRAFVRFDLLGDPEQPCQLGPDLYAPNHTCGSAFNIGTVTEDEEHHELVAEAAAPDFIKFRIKAEEEVEMTLVSDLDACDLDLYLYDSNCNLLASNTDAVDDPSLLWENPTMLDEQVILEIRVAAGSPHPCGVYDLQLDRRATDVCTPGWFEDGLEDNDSVATALPLQPGAYQELYLNSDDADFFAVELPAGATITSTIVQHPDTVPGPSAIYARIRSVNGGVHDNGGGTQLNGTVVVDWTNTTGQTLTVVQEIYLSQQLTSVYCTLYDFTLEIAPAVPFGTYCAPAELHSAGVAGHLVPSGSAAVATNDLVLTAQNLPPNQFGYFLVAPAQAEIPLVGGSQGTLCLGGPIGRFTNLTQSSGASGSITIPIDLSALPTPGQPYAVQPGESWNFQAWFRDFNPTPTSNMTDALEVTFL